jgi:uncharacterized membrane protein HdeD (DUF308 family)
VLLRGITAVAFAVIALVWRPYMTPAKLGLLFGMYALLHGLLSLIAAVGGRGQRGCWLLAIEGMAGLAAGAAILLAPSAGPIAAGVFIWLWAMVTGGIRISEAIRLRRELSGDIWLMLSGLVTVLLAFILLLRPVVGAVGVAWLLAGFALMWGLFEILLGCELRALRHGRIASQT